MWLDQEERTYKEHHDPWEEDLLVDSEEGMGVHLVVVVEVEEIAEVTR